MASNLSAQFLLPVATALGLAIAFAVWPSPSSSVMPGEPSTQKASPAEEALPTVVDARPTSVDALVDAVGALIEADAYRSEHARMQALLDQERLRFTNEKAKRVGSVRAEASELKERLREQAKELDAARAARIEATKRVARMQAELEALRTASNGAEGK